MASSVGFRGYGGKNVRWSQAQPNMTRCLPGSANAQPTGQLSDPLFLGKELAWKSLPDITNPSEMPNGCLKRKTMSMDLAMQREQVHRRNTEKLRKQTPDGLLPSPTSIQGVSSNSKVLGVKRAAITANLAYPQPQPKQPYQSYEPPSGNPSSIHSQLIQTYQSCEPHSGDPSSTESQLMQPCQAQSIIIYCKECQVPCSGALNLRQHYQGKKHKAKLEELRMQKNGGKMGTEPLMCQVCKVPCMNKLNYQQHLKGKKHAASLQAIYAASSLGKEQHLMAEWEELVVDS